MHHPIDRIVHNTAFVTPVVEHWLEREIAHCWKQLKLPEVKNSQNTNILKTGKWLFSIIFQDKVVPKFVNGFFQNNWL